MRPLAFALLFGVSLASFAIAQHAPHPQVSQLDPADVHFACSIADVTFVYPKAAFELGRGEKAIGRAAKESDIVAACVPSSAMNMLFQYAAGYEVTHWQHPSLTRERVESIPFPVWHGVWSLLPKDGNVGGFPYQYHSFARSDGKRIVPEIYFCDYVNVDGHRYFSSLSFAKIESSSFERSIDADTALDLARTAVRELTPLANSLRLRQLMVQKLPFARDAWNKDAFVYEIEFTDKTNDDLSERAKFFSIWVTTNGLCSTLSADRWTIGEGRTKR